MPRSTLGGNDPFHELPDHEKDRIEKILREKADEEFKKGFFRKRKEMLNRARNISREKSKKTHHQIIK